MKKDQGYNFFKISEMMETLPEEEQPELI